MPVDSLTAVWCPCLTVSTSWFPFAFCLLSQSLAASVPSYLTKLITHTHGHLIRGDRVLFCAPYHLFLHNKLGLG